MGASVTAMSPEIAHQIQLEQDHGREKWGDGPDDFAHDDATPLEMWHRYIDDHNERGRLATPMEQRQELVKIAGLAVSAIEAIDRKELAQ